jgi:hypothetical protein
MLLGSQEGLSKTLYSVGEKLPDNIDGLLLGLFDGFTVGIVEGRLEGLGKLLGAKVGLRVLLDKAFVITYTAPTLFKAYGADTSKSRNVSLL